MGAGELLLLMAAALAKGLHSEPGGFIWSESVSDVNYRVIVLCFNLTKFYDLFAQVRHTCVACHTRRLFLIRISVGLLSLEQQVSKALTPCLLVVSIWERLQDPSELFFLFA